MYKYFFVIKFILINFENCCIKANEIYGMLSLKDMNKHLDIIHPCNSPYK